MSCLLARLQNKSGKLCITYLYYYLNPVHNEQPLFSLIPQLLLTVVVVPHPVSAVKGHLQLTHIVAGKISFQRAPGTKAEQGRYLTDHTCIHTDT